VTLAKLIYREDFTKDVYKLRVVDKSVHIQLKNQYAKTVNIVIPEGPLKMNRFKKLVETQTQGDVDFNFNFVLQQHKNNRHIEFPMQDEEELEEDIKTFILETDSGKEVTIKT